ncbi:hypothetical protein J6590_038819 [Homalodisca vitripennis]|nr:hypothetical protein J6590_038819 [Homalodisca vitripennis]
MTNVLYANLYTGFDTAPNVAEFDDLKVVFGTHSFLRGEKNTSFSFLGPSTWSSIITESSKQRRACILLGWVTAERSCPCKQPVCLSLEASFKQSDNTPTHLSRSRRTSLTKLYKRRQMVKSHPSVHPPPLAVRHPPMSLSALIKP